MNQGGYMVYDPANNRLLVTAVGLPTNDDLWQIPISNPAGATQIGLIGFNSTNKILIDPTTGIG
jgi:hypothetical protein